MKPKAHLAIVHRPERGHESDAEAAHALRLIVAGWAKAIMPPAVAADIMERIRRT